MANCNRRGVMFKYIGLVVIITLTSFWNDIWWISSSSSLLPTLTSLEKKRTSSLLVGYQDDDNNVKNKTLNPIEFFQTIVKLGGNDWISINNNSASTKRGPDHDFASSSLLMDKSVSLQKLASIAVEVGSVHLVRPVLPPLSLDDISKPPTIEINCSNPIYSSALTGRLDTLTKKILLDAVPFGFDTDYLEIRLLEISDIVDKMIVVEQNSNHKGILKPFYIVPKLLDIENNGGGRLSRFVSKIDFLPVDETRNIRKIRSNPKRYQWIIEKNMRYKAIDYIRKKYSHLDDNHDDNNKNKSQQQQQQQRNVVYVIQNDGDEIPERNALAHFKECELKDSQQQITVFPSFQYKRNTGYLQRLPDFQGIPLFDDEGMIPPHHVDLDIYKNLQRFVWSNGPIVMPLRLALDKTNFRSYKLPKPLHHMGLGSANHFSSPSHPILNFLKRSSTVESKFVTGGAASGDSSEGGVMSKKFYQNALIGTLTNYELRKITHNCFEGMKSQPPHPWMTIHDMMRRSSKKKKKKTNNNNNNNTTMIPAGQQQQQVVLDRLKQQHLPQALARLSAKSTNNSNMTIKDLPRGIQTLLLEDEGPPPNNNSNNNNNNNNNLEDVLYQHLPWAVKRFGKERYPWLFRPNIVEEEQLVNNCLCFGNCDDISPHSTIFFGTNYEEE